MIAPMPRKKIKSLLEVVSELFSGESSSSDLPVGVERLERVTSEAVRIKFIYKVDYNLLSAIAAEEGYSILTGSFAPRVMDKGTIVARVGSQSDPGGGHDIFIYLLPATVEQMSTYGRVMASQCGVLGFEAGRINFERLYDHNLRIIRLVEKYRKNKYQSLTRKLEL